MAKNIFVLSALKILCQEELLRMAEIHKSFKQKKHEENHVTQEAFLEVESFKGREDQYHDDSPGYFKAHEADQVENPNTIKNARPVIKEGEENTMIPTDVVLWYRETNRQTVTKPQAKSKISGFYRQNQFVPTKKAKEDSDVEESSSTNGVLVNKKLA